ncbi:MAG: 16S rRNA (cytosine(967)-C(5))-methyltransferase [Neptuniibacter caesariensis]|uniref:16S rRNA (cytosine(967)-C(5))-methyltransferase n=1 Tax=Neptuniibacter caesariensis TaxID=207954 RepID=A0A2G6JAM2_NEPCE|nr:MAG: 16S rRNA (cytosine(967)-C(5))-methyltransferase [Neptuniibacter caesariensis]
MSHNIRTLAARALAPLLQNKGSLTTKFTAIERHCPADDRALLRELCYGTLRFYPQLNKILSRLQNHPFKHRDTDVRALALVGLYQIQHTRIPAHAAIYETVEACKELKKSNAVKLLNAILRRFQREQADIIAPLSSDEVYRYNHPEWMIAKLKNNWPEHWQAILAANNEQAPLTLRVNRRSSSREEFQQQLDPIVASEQTQYSAHGLRLAHSVNVELLPGYQTGAFSVQDEAAQLAAELLDLQPGQNVLDACAAPGGKLSHILEAEPRLGRVEAVELESKRAERISENLARLRLHATLHIGDAAEQAWWDGTEYDRILLDAPCSATGVIRKNPDIKYLRKGEDIHALAQIQADILQNCWAMLKPGGKLLYATCSIFPQENERQIQRFIRHNTDAQHLPIEAEWGLERAFGRQLFPQKDGHDGFYYALLEKTE